MGLGWIGNGLYELPNEKLVDRSYDNTDGCGGYSGSDIITIKFNGDGEY